MSVDKKLLVDSTGRPLTQGLFLEIDYNGERAVFTLKDDDHEHKGKTYISLKKRFLEMEDIVEYDFAKEWLLGWSHWQRLNRNKILAKYFAEWREELELSLRSQAVRDIIGMSADDKGFQAAKWIADRGWDKRAAGRPSKSEKLKEERMQAKLDDEFSGDVVRLLGK